MELHAIEFPEEVVGELEVGFVDLVDEEDDALRARERLAQLAEFDVAFDVADVALTELAVVEALDGVVHIQPVLRLGRRLDAPGDEPQAEALGDALREHRLARAGLPLDEEGATELDGDVHGLHELGRGDVVARAGVDGHARGGRRRRWDSCGGRHAWSMRRGRHVRGACWGGREGMSVRLAHGMCFRSSDGAGDGELRPEAPAAVYQRDGG